MHSLLPVLSLVFVSSPIPQGKYEDAVRMYRRGFEIAQDLAAVETTETTRVEYGIALAHTLLTGYSQCMDQVGKSNIQRLLDFKSSRWDTFSEEATADDEVGEGSQPSSDVGSGENGDARDGEGEEENEATDPAPEGEAKEEPANGGTDSGVTSEGENGSNDQTEVQQTE